MRHDNEGNREVAVRKKARIYVIFLLTVTFCCGSISYYFTASCISVSFHQSFCSISKFAVRLIYAIKQFLLTHVIRRVAMFCRLLAVVKRNNFVPVSIIWRARRPIHHNFMLVIRRLSVLLSETNISALQKHDQVLTTH